MTWVLVILALAAGYVWGYCGAFKDGYAAALDRWSSKEHGDAFRAARYRDLLKRRK